MKIEFSEKASLGVVRCQEAESEVRFARNPIGGLIDQWETSFWETGPLGVVRCQEAESDVRFARNPIGGLGTNENRIFRKRLSYR